ncbi:MAG TPA: hypothetical protein VFZ72_01475 [Jiangellaceae bacterium]
MLRDAPTVTLAAFVIANTQHTAVGAGGSSEAGVYAGQKAGVRGDALQQRDESSPAGFIECSEKFGVESYEFRPTGPANGANVSS